MLRTCPQYTVYPHYQTEQSGSRYHDDTPDIKVAGMPNHSAFSYVEVSITSPHRSDVQTQAACFPLAAASALENRRLAQYTGLATRTNCSLYVAALETTCAFGAGLQDLVERCSSNHDALAFEDSAPLRTFTSRHYKSYWMQRIALAYWAGFYQKALCRRRHIHGLPQSEAQGEGLFSSFPRAPGEHWVAPDDCLEALGFPQLLPA